MENDPKHVPQSGMPTVIKRRGQSDKIIADFKRKSHYGWLRYDLLKVDHEYQRKLQLKKAIKMAHTWDADMDPPWIVNRRTNGDYYIIDAQHRFIALGLIENRPEKVFCQIFNGLTKAEEARYFNNFDTMRDNLTAGDSFRSDIVADDKENIKGITRAASKAGVTVDYNLGPLPGNVRAYKTLIKIYNRQGEEKLTRILRICRKAWPTHRDFANQPVLLGLEIFLDKFEDQISEKMLIDNLSKYDPQFLVNQARAASGSLSSTIYPSVARVIKDVYNKKRTTNRLAESI